MSFSSLPNWAYLAILVMIIIVAGVGETLHLIPAGTFYTIFLFVAGIFIPSPLPHPAQTALPVAPVTPAPAPATAPAATVVEPVVVDRSRG